LTNLLLSTFYRFFPSSKPSLAPQASPAQVALANSTAQRHFRYARITLVVSYLAYSILDVYSSQTSAKNQNFYRLVGLSREVVESELGPASVKAQWRRLARVYHPDKVGKGGEARFVELRRGVEVLENDEKRWAYERFGPTILEWGNKLVSNREYLVKGVTNAAAFWIFAFVSIVGISFFRKDERRNNFVSFSLSSPP
jgi:preprotein translocase subunit Sec63